MVTVQGLGAGQLIPDPLQPYTAPAAGVAVTVTDVPLA